ncbi:lactoylglutathione lyase [Oscillospiraceae bacterium HV4-5-C5C]|nr:lactoylglutathione lyase [Oscillospiraceae bacterium HV4-5-C5C]
MDFAIKHTNLNVRDLERSVAFLQEALGLKVARSKTAADGSFKLVFMTDSDGAYEIELTWLRDHQDKPYDLGENESHICLAASDYEAAHQKHQAMGCICFENKQMGLYFIEDPDGYWYEIVRA